MHITTIVLHNINRIPFLERLLRSLGLKREYNQSREGLSVIAFGQVCLSVHLFVCLSVSVFSKTYTGPIDHKLSHYVSSNPKGVK